MPGSIRGAEQDGDLLVSHHASALFGIGVAGGRRSADAPGNGGPRCASAEQDRGRNDKDLDLQGK